VPTAPELVADAVVSRPLQERTQLAGDEPCSPAARISRSTWQRGTGAPATPPSRLS